MLDSGATLNLINSSLVKQRCLPMETRTGFQVKVAGGTLLPCTHLVPQLSITMANHTVTEDFFIVDLDDMEVILGIQWRHSMNTLRVSNGWTSLLLSMERRLFSAEWKMKVRRKFLHMDGGNFSVW